jgi:DNA-binding transcriptional ArsR family regulator
MSTTFEVLAEPNRRRILDLLRDRERSVNELVELVRISQPGVSKHLRVLRQAGLVTVRVDAQRRWYRLRPEPLTEIDTWLEPYRRYWAGRLDALEEHLDRDAPSPDGRRGRAPMAPSAARRSGSGRGPPPA